ncbi:hypothetical protein YC2023_097876 [Brassica napus]
MSRHSIDEPSLDRSVVTSIDESSLDRRVLTRPTSPHSTDESSLDRRVLTRPTSPHSTDESSLDQRVLTRPFYRHFDRRVVVSIRFKLSMRPSLNPTDESSSRLFTSLLTVLGSNSWRPPWGMGKYLRGRLNWSPFCCHSTDESSLDRRSSLDRSVVTRRRAFSRSRFARSLAVTRSISRSRSRNKTISQHVGARIVLSDAYARARPCLSDKRTSTRTH